jgi:hypothetical protein
MVDGRWTRLPRISINSGTFGVGPFGIGPFGIVCVQGFDHTSVGSDQVDAAVSVAATSQLLTMLRPDHVRHVGHLNRPQRITTRGVHPDCTIVDTHRRCPLAFVKLLIVERAVLIGLHHKMFDRISTRTIQRLLQIRLNRRLRMLLKQPPRIDHRRDRCNLHIGPARPSWADASTSGGNRYV